MGDHYRGARYLFLLGRGVVLATVSSVGDLASTLPCWEWFSFGEQSWSVGDSRGLLGEQSLCVPNSRCVFLTVVGCWGNSRGLFVFLGCRR